MGKPEQNHEDSWKANTYLAALRATAPLVPITAVLITVSIYFAFKDVSERLGYEPPSVIDRASTVIGGFLATSLIWLVVAYFYRGHTAADRANLRNYNLLCQRLDRLENRIRHVCPRGSELREEPANGIDNTTRNKACEHAIRECSEIRERLDKSRGMPWVTGIGYIELWHRVHRAEEALMKVEPCTETLAWAMHDESSLMGSNMTNKDSLLKRLRCAVAILDDSETGENLHYLVKPAKCSLSPDERKKSKNQAKAISVLSEVRYEINNFRDNVWEGIINARNRLTDTSVLLGLAAYALLVLAILANAHHKAILWATVFFLVGAVAGFFARLHAEWTSDTATDDFGLSTARLIHIPWLSGLAAVGGVLITSILDDNQFINNIGSTSTLSELFKSSPALLVVAAVFGLTPDLIIRRLTQQADKYKEDLQSTQPGQGAQNGQRTETR